MKNNIYILSLITVFILFFTVKSNAQTTDTTIGTCNYPSDYTGEKSDQLTKSDCDAAGGSWSGPYKLLAPLPCADGTDGCVGGKLITFDPHSGDNGENTKLGDYLNLMIKIIIGVSAVMAVFMIVIGGIEYMTADLMSTKESGKSKIEHALLGLLIALGSYALLNTINPELLRTDFKSLVAQKVVVDVRSLDKPMVAVNGKYTFNNKTYAQGSSWDLSTSGELADLSYSGATVYNSQCTTVGQQNCTSTRGLDVSVLNNIRDKCASCQLVITGGTEFWLHNGGTSTNHQVANSNVDLAVNPALTQYIMSGNSNPAPYSWHQKDGIWYYYEVNHWHASVNKN